jgi:DNA-binding PadR family transcriptional regulator
MDGERPRKVYKLTSEGHELLSCTEKSLNLIVKTIGVNGGSKTANGTEQISVAASFFPKKTQLYPALAQ